ncbi:3-keto-disaccharide hydrolase [Spirosoma jeollabukense]
MKFSITTSRPALSRALLLTLVGLSALTNANAQTGVGVKAPKGAEVLFDGSRKMLDEKWTYWKGPRLAATLPIKWAIEKDPAGSGTVMNTNDPAAAGGKYGAADIVTKETFRDFRLHVEFYVSKPGGNSGVYLQNRYEIQIFDGDTTSHGLGAVINESPSPYKLYTGPGKWNAYDIEFRAARFVDGKRTEPALVTLYLNGKKAHTNQKITQVWGGPNSGIDGGNEDGKGVTDTPGGLKLQAEGHDVLYRNIWIEKMDLKKADTNF